MRAGKRRGSVPCDSEHSQVLWDLRPISISQRRGSLVIVCRDPGPTAGREVPRRRANAPQMRNPFANLSVPVGLRESRVSSSPGCPGLQPSPPAQRAACLCDWWHSSRKLCRREDELLVLAAEDHLPILDKEEEQQPWHRPALLRQGSPGSPGCSVDRWL